MNNNGVVNVFIFCSEAIVCHFFATLLQTQFICLDRLAVFVVTVNGNLQLILALIERIRNMLLGLFNLNSINCNCSVERKIKKGFHGDARVAARIPQHVIYVLFRVSKQTFVKTIQFAYSSASDWLILLTQAWVGSFSRLVSLPPNCIRINESAII